MLFLPTWSIIHSRHWKAQIPYLARHHRVLTSTGAATAAPTGRAAATPTSLGEFADDTLAVMDATGTESALLVALSAGALWGPCSPPTIPSGSTGSSISARRRRSPPAIPSARATRSRSGTRPMRAGRSSTGTTG